METILFASTNEEKVLIAKTVCSSFGLLLGQLSLNIDEIQGEDPVLIVKDKSRRAFEEVNKAVVVSDDSWDIPALRGFPGPYMKSLNKWFKPDDFLRLMNGLNDRRIILHQFLAYNDAKEIKVFQNDIYGEIIEEARGHNEKSPNMSVIVLDGDNGKTISEVFEQGASAVSERYLRRPDVWHPFIKWYLEHQ